MPDAWDCETLNRRAPDGSYVVSESDLVHMIRSQRRQGGPSDYEIAQPLMEALVERSKPIFLRHTKGLSHRPDLREDAIADMIEQLLREALDPHEKFMKANFIHYLDCLAIDCFKRVLRHEGLSYRRDAQGNPNGKGKRVPRSLMDRLDLPTSSASTNTDVEGISREAADPNDLLGARLDAQRALDILAHVSDPRDRLIVLLRAEEELPWDDIAAMCEIGESTARRRFADVTKSLRQWMLAD